MATGAKKSRKMPLFHLLVGAWLLEVGMAAVREDEAPIFFALQFQSGIDIPEECQSELLLPTSALTGNPVDWEYMCGADYFDKCYHILQFIFKLEYTLAERQFVNSLFNAFTDIGATFACNKTTETIQHIMDEGGSECIVNNKTAIAYCSYVSILKFESGQYMEGVCGALDLSFECNMMTISNCNASGLHDLWESYYRATITRTPCNKFSKYGNEGQRKQISQILIGALLIASALLLFVRP